MRSVILSLLILGAAAWAAGPDAAVPMPAPGPSAATPSPAVTGDGAPVAPSSVSSGAPAESSSSDVGEVVLLSSGEGGCTFEITIPEPNVSEVEAKGRRFQRYTVPFFLAVGDEGEPETLARRIHIAAPPEAQVSVEVEKASFDVRTGVNLYPRPHLGVEERHGEQTLTEEFTYDAEAYRDGTYPAKLAALDGEDIVRGYRLISVAVSPYQYQPATGTLRVVKSMVVRLSFRGGVRRPNERYPARPVEKGIFTRVIPAVVLNHEVASEWPFAGGITPPVRDAGVWPSDFADKAALKVVVEEEALYRLSYAELKAAGFPVDTLNPAHLRLYSGPGKRLPRDFNYEPPALTELPIYVAGQGDGRFDPGDYVEFYGHGCDFFEHVEPNENGSQVFSKDRFTRYNMYWLVADAAPGKRMVAAAVAPAGGAKPPYFWDRIRLEEDIIDVAETEYEVKEEDEYWYWRIFSGPSGPSLLKSFILKDPVTGEGAPKTYIQMMVREQESIPGGNGPHHTIVYLNSTDEGHVVLKEPKYDADEETYLRKRFDSGLLLNGQNRLYFKELNDVATTGIDFLMVDHFEFEYPRHYRAYQDYIHFSNPPSKTGKLLFEIPGFTTDDLAVYDLTRGRRLTDFEVSSAGGEYTIRFTDDVPSGQCWYVATANATTAARKPVDFYIDAGSRLREMDDDVDMIVVCYDAYYDNIMPLVNLRRASGLNVFVARVTDVYDEYSWGLYDPGATRSFVKDVYRKSIFRPGGVIPDHLLLVGDAYKDHRDNYGNFTDRKIWREFGRNQVPTYYITTSPSGRSACDNWFVAMSGSLAPDLALGRLSAPFEDNIDAIVEKIVNYERHPPNGAWNNRVIFVADNNDKDGTGGGDFTRDNEDIEENYAPFGFEVHKENIEWLTRRFPVSVPKKEGFDYMTRGERQYWVGRLMKPDFLKGFNGIIMHYSGHGGPQVWSHENLFLQHKDDPPIDDVDKLENGPYLPIIIQCSCSTAYFDQWSWKEDEPLDFGQSISEYILQARRNAAVAAMGSTRLGTEGAQHQFMQSLYGYIFPNRKTRSAPVTVGEAHMAGKIAVGSTVRDMFVLLGDPSMTIAIPKPGLSLTLDKANVKRGGKIKVSGTVPNNFNGKAVVQLFDRPWYFYSGDMYENIYRERLLTTAEVEVVNGRFDATLVVPTVPVNPVPTTDAGPAPAVVDAAGTASAAAGDVAAATGASPAAAASPDVVRSYAPVAEYGVARVKALAYGTGFRQLFVCNEDVTINVTGEVNSADNLGPDLGVYLNDYSFRSGDPSDSTPTLLVDVRDDSGVLIARNLEAIDKGNKEKTFVPFTARITKPDPKFEPSVLDLTYYYKPDVGDYRGGTAEKEIALSDGENDIIVTAYDNLGNKSEREIKCFVSGALGLTELVNCPNPFEDDTYFTFVSSSDLDSLVIKIYTATGRCIQKLETGGLPAGYNQIHWDGLDGDGDRIANGVYFYTVTARAGDEKLVARQKMFKLR